MRQGYSICRQRAPVNFSMVGWIALITVISSLLGLILWSFYPPSINWLALNPSNVLQGKYIWTVGTHMFMHGGFFHLFVNIFVLFSLGGLCEKIIGRKRFIWFYLGAGLFAGILSVVLSGFFGESVIGGKIFGSPEVYMVGASGAIFAIAGLFVILLPRLKFSIIFLPFFSLPAYVMVPLVLLITWATSIGANLPIGNVAHLGGFLAGLFYGLCLKIKYRRKVEILQRHFR